MYYIKYIVVSIQEVVEFSGKSVSFFPYFKGPHGYHKDTDKNFVPLWLRGFNLKTHLFAGSTFAVFTSNVEKLTMKISKVLYLVAIAMFISSACGRHTFPGKSTPGNKRSANTEALEAGADVLQAKAPLRKINIYLNGFHFYSGDMAKQIEAHHFCSKLNEKLIQCIIYDGNTGESKIVGVEYIISEELFKVLPQEERKLWHSHRYEVKSGQLIAPGIPGIAEHELMEQIVSTYGKTWHIWHSNNGDTLPTGSPKLMMGFTDDGQIDEEFLKNRNTNFNISTDENRQNRKDIPTHEILPGADAWQRGEVKQLPSLVNFAD